jgi:ubiquinone/menaquinone biosynthesis C-methylase UbiE
MKGLNRIFGYENEAMPNIAFRMMSIVMRMRDFFFPLAKRVTAFAIENGDTVIDYGCGPGRYVAFACRAVGSAGRVYAVDVHPLAIEAVEEKAAKQGLTNLLPVLSTGYPTDIASHTADIIIALDMFHHVTDVDAFLAELQRLLKPAGRLYIERGHQPTDDARQKLVRSGKWTIASERGNLFECRIAKA